MAGLYPDPPNHRMAYDRDGTVGFWLPNGVASVTVATQAELNNANNEVALAGGQNTHQGFLFPEARDITHVWHHHQNAGNFSVSWSNNTTNGLDGTWTTIAGTYANGTNNKEGRRNTIRTLSAPVLGVKALRVFTAQVAGGSYAAGMATHLYGEVSVPDKNLDLWDETLNQQIAHTLFELGDVTIGDTHSREFRVKNHSATLTANNVVVDASALTDATPAYASAWEFSLDGTTWATSVTIPSIAPGGISGVVYTRIFINSTVSLWWQRITALATTWI